LTCLTPFAPAALQHIPPQAYPAPIPPRVYLYCRRSDSRARYRRRRLWRNRDSSWAWTWQRL